MVQVSERFRLKLRNICERLLGAGFNCFPKYIDSKAPAFKPGESYERYLVEPIPPDSDFAKLILQRFTEDPRVGGIAVAGGVGGLAIIDYDATKVSGDAIAYAIHTVLKYGELIYADLRVDRELTDMGGWHFALRVNTELLQGKRIKISHPFQAEFRVKLLGLVTIAPSRLLDGGKSGKMWRYVKAPLTADLPETLYDQRLDTLPKIIQELGGKMVLESIDAARVVGEWPGDGKPAHGLKLGINGDNVWDFLERLAIALDCPGFLRFVQAVRAGVWPVRYAIYSDLAPADHPRSTWTVAENVLFRALAEAGAEDSAFDAVYDAVVRAQEVYQRAAGPVDHTAKRVRENMKAVRKFRDHGHDRKGYCIFKLVGLCDRITCDATTYGRLTSPMGRQALQKAALSVFHAS
jgi:hypothetical protein